MQPGAGMPMVDQGNPASVAAGNRAQAAQGPDLTPILDALGQAAGGYGPEDQAKIAQAAQLLSEVGQAGIVSPVANGSAH